MSNLPSRKTFFAKLLGLVAVAGLAPRLAAQASKPLSPRVSTPIQIQADRRAIARSEAAR